MPHASKNDSVPPCRYERGMIERSSKKVEGAATDLMRVPALLRATNPHVCAGAAFGGGGLGAAPDRGDEVVRRPDARVRRLGRVEGGRPHGTQTLGPHVSTVSVLISLEPLVNISLNVLSTC